MKIFFKKNIPESGSVRKRPDVQIQPTDEMKAEPSDSAIFG